MAKVYTGICPLRIEVEASEMGNIPAYLLDDLECGDVVVKHTVESGKDLYHTYQVAHKQATGLCLVYCDYETIEEIYYEKGSSGWAFGEKHVRSFDAGQAE